MNIIIAGCGKVGYTIAKNLSQEGHNIVIIDKKTDVYDKIVESIDVMVVRGNALSARVLIEAGAEDADLIISVTEGDETNILCCLTAKNLGAKHTIARVRDPEYALELSARRNDFGIDMIINPEQQAAREISRILRFHAANDIETFVGGKVELVSFEVTNEDFFVNQSILQIFQKTKNPIILATVVRNNEPIIPHGNLVLREKDIVSVMGRASEITAFFKYIGKSTQKARDALIIGGGKIAYYLGESLARHNVKIKIIEIDEEKCVELSESLPKALIIQGDGTDDEVLNSEGFADADAVVCLTERDEDNVIIALNAMQVGVEKVIVKINHINQNMVRNLGLNSIICPKNTTAYQIIRYVRGISHAADSEIVSMYRITDTEEGKIDALEFNIGPQLRFLNKPIKELNIKKNVLFGCIVRKNEIIIPKGSSEIKKSDNVIIVVKDENIYKIEDIFE